MLFFNLTMNHSGLEMERTGSTAKFQQRYDESGARNLTGFKTQLAEWDYVGRCMQYQETGSNDTDMTQVMFLVLRNKKNMIVLLPVVYPRCGTLPKALPSLTLEHLQKTKVELGLLLYSRFVSNKKGCFPDTKPTFCIA